MKSHIDEVKKINSSNQKQVKTWTSTITTAQKRFNDESEKNYPKNLRHWRTIGLLMIMINRYKILFAQETTL